LALHWIHQVTYLQAESHSILCIMEGNCPAVTLQASQHNKEFHKSKAARGQHTCSMQPDLSGIKQQVHLAASQPCFHSQLQSPLVVKLAKARVPGKESNFVLMINNSAQLLVPELLSAPPGP
jgi:hypothetical protein